jgi:hypothetical protein
MNRAGPEKKSNCKGKIMRYFIVVLTLFFSFSATADDIQAIYEQIFGDLVKLDPVMHQKVRDGEAGKRHYTDTDGDGKPDEVWFIDTALRHPEDWRPILVKVVDEDGDLEEGFEPDLDSDLYIADWHADGTVDVICDYQDNDGDNDVDEMAFYFPQKGRVTVWWGDDLGDDNLLWYDVGYTYRQRLCQYRTHFGGEELFCNFSLGLGDTEWFPAWENPFIFYDHDKDGVTEEVVRIEGKREAVGKLRYSYDADHDATWDNPRDFDVSISAHAKDGMTFGDDLCETRVIRGIPTGPFLSFDDAQAYSLSQSWASYQLCWVEDDLNMNGDSLKEGKFTEPIERWEGVITKGNEWFSQIGGPSVGLFNNRVETDADPDGPIAIYYSETDHRIHLKGADHAWLIVDYDYDQKGDLRYDYHDTDGDGIIDTWRLDIDNDGTVDSEWQAGPEHTRPLGYTWEDVSGCMQPLMQTLPDKFFRLAQLLAETCAARNIAIPEKLLNLFETSFETGVLTVELRKRLAESPEAHRYFFSVACDIMLARLEKNYTDTGFWKKMGRLRASGDLDAMGNLLAEHFGLRAAHWKYSHFRDRIMNAFVKDQTAWAGDWLPPNIAWQSDAGAFRAYWGQFDFFGKKDDSLFVQTFSKGDVNYHAEQDWGMDALHVGATGGLGGVTLYADGKAWPVWSPEGKGPIQWSKQLIEDTDNRVAIELKAENAGPLDNPYTVTFRCSIEAGHPESEITVSVRGGDPDADIQLGLNIPILQQEQFNVDPETGIMASWGIQDPEIGWIGLGVLFPPAAYLKQQDCEDQHQVVMRIGEDRSLTYHIQGTWLRGRRFSRCPVLVNWIEDLKRTKAGLIK